MHYTAFSFPLPLIPVFRHLRTRKNESVDEFGAPFDSDTLSDHLLLIKFFRAHW